MPPAIVALNEAYPGLQVTVIDARNELIIEAVRFGRADCGIGTFSALEIDIERNPLARDRMMLFCRKNSPFANKTSVTW